MRRAILAIVVAVACVAATHKPAPAQCALHIGARVVLYGTSDDPDVFVWDSRFRMRTYAEGSFDQAQALLPHALLVPPGTRAWVTACVREFVASKFTDRSDDAIGIVIASGRYHGREGWVLATDVRSIVHRMERQPHR